MLTRVLPLIEEDFLHWWKTWKKGVIRSHKKCNPLTLEVLQIQQSAPKSLNFQVKYNMRKVFEDGLDDDCNTDNKK